MRKNLTLPTLIVLLIALLAAGACSLVAPPPEDAPITVKIHFKVEKKNGNTHLKMYDTFKRKRVVDTLETLVMPGDTVIWEPTNFFSRIKVVEKIGSEEKGKIINMDAEQIPGTRNFRLIIPENAPIPSEREKYDIEFKDRQGRTWKIDPYLRIPRERPTTQ